MHRDTGHGTHLHDGGDKGCCDKGVGVVVVDDVRMRCLEIELGWAEGQIRPDRPYISAQLRFWALGRYRVLGANAE